MACSSFSTSRECPNRAWIAPRDSSDHLSFHRRSPSDDAHSGFCSIWYSQSRSKRSCSALVAEEAALFSAPTASTGTKTAKTIKARNRCMNNLHKQKGKLAEDSD